MTDYQRIYNRLRQKGLSDVSALAFLGNWQCESGCEAYRVQGDFSSFRTGSKHYTQLIQTGAATRDSFAKDQKGYGLAQWTFYTRKYNLYDFWTARGGAIDDIEMQCDFCVWELNREYFHVKQKLSSCVDLHTAVDIICCQYEQPAVNNVSERYNAALLIKDKIKRGDVYEEPEDPIDDPVSPPGDDEGAGGIISPATDSWPLRGIRGGKEDPGLCNGMTGKDVTVLQAILQARGYYDGQLNGQFDSFLDSAVKKFQSDQRLAVDGIVGPITWGKVMSYE